jgi:hypothetical protein
MMSLAEFLANIPKDQFQIRYGESVLSEFVRSHDYTSLIDELVQNDYDAESPESEIELLPNRLVSRGFGDPIDEAGWQRLEMVMGTGKDTLPKKSHLGIKNQGLRALFLLGDFIIVRSGGYSTVLSLVHGSLKRRQEDNSTKGASGTIVEVPYRSTETSGLPVFTAEKEEKLMRDLEANLPTKLGMLSTPEYRRVMNKVTVTSKRTGIRLICRQEILRIESTSDSKTELERRITLEKREDITK